MKILVSINFYFFLLNILIASKPFRTWTSSDGRKVEATFIELVGDSVKIKNTQGREFILPIAKLSKADQEYAKDLSSKNFITTPSSIFNLLEPFDDRGVGGIIVISTMGEVRVITADSYRKQKGSDHHSKSKDSSKYSDPKGMEITGRDAIIGESIPIGSTIKTGVDSEVNLLLTNGTLAKLGSDSKLVLNTFWQKNFEPSAKKVTQLEEEVSSSRVALGLEIGDLVVDVKKLNKDSYFMIDSPLGTAGVRGTQFGFSVNSKSTELAVLEGKVGFQDVNQRTDNVETGQEIVGSELGASDIDSLPDTKKIKLTNAVLESIKVAVNYDLPRLANTVEGYTTKPNYIVKSALNMELIWCPPGSFTRGVGKDDNSVILTKGFYLGKHEVTQEQYKRVMRENRSSFKGKKFPVEKVSWHDAIAFCNALTMKERLPRGWGFVLPSEAQWEYSCRAGSTTKFSWGDVISPKLANYIDSGLNKTNLVGSYHPNEWGFQDMHGNVEEWISDWYDNKYPIGNVSDPLGPTSGTHRVRRGGSWLSDWSRLPSSSRGNYPPDAVVNDIGFRVCFQSIN